MSTIALATRRHLGAAALTAGIVALALTSAYIHFTLGGPLFTMNALGYLVLAAAIVVGAVSTHRFVVRFSWLPRVALIGYAAASIVAWLLMGGFYWLGYLTKGIEVALIGLLIVDLYRVYGGLAGLVRHVVASVRWTVASIRG